MPLVKKSSWKWAIALVVVTAVGSLFAFNKKARSSAEEALRQLATASTGGEEKLVKKDRVQSAPTASWDGILTLTEKQQKTIGLRTVRALSQTEPTVLRLTGTTDYDPTTLTIVRAPFDSRVDRVLKDLGDVVKKGDPVLELFSTDLADAKSGYEIASSQWLRDKKVLDYKTPLAKADTIARKELIEIENDEAQSRGRMKVAKDKLLVYGLTEKEIEAAKEEEGIQKAKMILRSRADGIVIKRTLVQGNFYDAKDELMTIAPLERLWVRGSVSEIDADKVKVGQSLQVVFPYSHVQIPGKVEYIDKAIDPETRAAKFRTSIANADRDLRDTDRDLKAGMFVRVMLEIPPVSGRTVIPRVAMVSVDRYDYVFVKLPGAPARYERRPIFVAKENNDVVVVAEPSRNYVGLKADDEIVTNGALILEQMYEDRTMTETGILL
jgi:cobalt-zinc-cadmium efflux system membrane fusion protein